MDLFNGHKTVVVVVVSIHNKNNITFKNTFVLPI